MASKHDRRPVTDEVTIYLPEQHENETHLRVPLFELAALAEVPGSLTGFEVVNREGRPKASRNASDRTP